MVLIEKDMEQLYQNQTRQVTVHIRLTRELVGGQPADEKGVTAFVAHHMNITDAAKQAKQVAKILHEEIGERDIGPDKESAPALEETGVYQVCMIRRDTHGHWLGDWMFKAMLKQAGTQVGIFTRKKTTKGHLAEAGRILACGPSLKGLPYHVYLVHDDGKPVSTYYREFKGSVQTIKGRRSIVSHRECVADGANLHFTFDWVGRKLTSHDLAEIFAMGRQIGMGSTKSFERGKFEVVKFETDNKPDPVEEEPKKAAKKTVKKPTKAQMSSPQSNPVRH